MIHIIIAVLMCIVGVCYLGIAYCYHLLGNNGAGWAFLMYALANAGFFNGLGL